ncbi:hypothetical protein C8R48DRAFT_604037 [Suillus tomentosus]|nr:hypothetical protein C8R48DRAFT_604037 [Suillus tomentosus]
MHDAQILSVTCDNVSNNDMMIVELSGKMLEFGGATTHMQCFLHTINLVVKSLI